MLGMLLGRRRYFEKSDVSCRVWHRILKSGIVMFIPLYCLRIFGLYREFFREDSLYYYNSVFVKFRFYGNSYIGIYIVMV